MENPPITRIEQLFDSFKDGESDALISVIEEERRLIFDYLLRMTGQRVPSIEVLDEVTKALSAEGSQYEDLADLRTKLYATARSFASHLWNADTSALMNEGVESVNPEDLPAHITVQDLVCCEKVIASLPAWEKEAILLSVRARFSIEEISKIMATPALALEESINSGYLKIAQQCSIDPGAMETGIASLPIHVVSETGDQGTAALSQIIGDIDKAQRPPGWWKRWVVFAVMVAGISVLVYFALLKFLR